MKHYCKLESGIICKQQGLSKLNLEICQFYDINTENGECDCSSCASLQLEVNFCPNCGYKYKASSAVQEGHLYTSDDI